MGLSHNKKLKDDGKDGILAKLGLQEMATILSHGNFPRFGFALPIFLALVGGFFESFSVGLIIPVFRGIMEGDFRFLLNAPLIGGWLREIRILKFFSNTQIFIFLLLFVFISVLTRQMILFASEMILDRRINECISNIQSSLFERYVNFGKYFLDKNNTGSLYSTLIPMVRSFYLVPIRFHGCVTSASKLLFYFVLMFCISWQLTLCSLLLLPFLQLAIHWVMKKTGSTSKEQARRSLEQADKMSNILGAIPLVKAYSQESVESEHFRKISRSLSDLQHSLQKKSAFLPPLQESMGLVGILFLVSLVAFMSVRLNHGEDFAAFLIFFYILRRAVSALSNFNNLRHGMVTRLGATKVILDAFKDDPKYFVEQGSEELCPLQKGIELRNLKFSYESEREILKGISFQVECGKVVALVGETGSGKTTIAHLLMRFYDCDTGSIFLDGKDIRNFTLESIRRHIAFVGQDTSLLHDTLRNNLAYGMKREINDDELMEVVKKAQLEELVLKSKDGLDTKIGDRGVRLSGGEKQRLSIARAMLKKSEILIFDEATSALDSQTETKIQVAINEAIKNKTVLVIAHRLSTIKHADHIVVLEDGEVVEEGAFEKLIKKGQVFKRYWNAQMSNS